MNYSRTISFLISVPLLALLIELTAPVLDEKYKITNYIRLILNMENNPDKKELKVEKPKSLKMINVKSSNGLSFKIPKHCTLQFQDSSLANAKKNIKDKDYTLSSNTKLNDLLEITESAKTGTIDVILCEKTDAIWNIVTQYYPYMESINESNRMNHCVSFGEAVNKINNGRAKLIRCEFEQETIGTNNLFIEFDVYNDGSAGKYKRFVYNFYYNKYFYNIFGQCHLDGSNDCDVVSEITLMLAKSFGK